MRTSSLPLAVAGAAVTLALALTGCTSDGDTSTRSASGTPTPTATAQPDNVCVDDVAYLQFTDETTELELPDGCSSVVVLGDGGTATLGAVGDLTVMGSGNTLDADSITRIDAVGDDNAVTYGGDAPEDLSEGSGNTLERR